MPDKSKRTLPAEEVADSWEDESSDLEQPNPEKSKASEAPERDGREAQKDSAWTRDDDDRPYSGNTDSTLSSSAVYSPDGTLLSSSSSRSRGGGGGGNDSSSQRRPEKTDAVARRLIAGALGVRAPRKTEEEREYEKATKEKERKRRDEERERQRQEKEAAAKERESMWDA